ncbi:MAG TPA: mandelate racemase/muconate lactonizing enzyme family protein [Firmicutes bacterium]|jgi:L-rhamnonate dehydratase|nr:mandelate racemase/muconate lactonizing enzyme family protein [Bacillota bacterium]
MKMKIDNIDVYLVSTAVKGNIADSTRQVESVGYVIVRLTTDTGLTGIGLTYHEVGGEGIRQLILKNLSTRVIGKDPFDTEAIWEDMINYMRGVGRKGLAFCALSAIDIALWDLKGKIVGLPLYKLLGGYRKKIPVYASGGWTSYTPDQLVAELQGMVADGYKVVKFKVGVKEGKCPEEDIERVKYVRKKLGPNIGIMIDANNAYQASTAIRVGRQLEDSNIYLFEEPVIADDMEGLAHVRASINIPIATGEHEYTKYGMRDLLLNKAVDIVQFDVTRCGGITEWMKMAAIAQAWNVVVAPHCMDYMHMHLVGAIPNGLMLERILTFEPVSELVFVDPPQPKDGFLEIPDKPGLGLTLNEENIKKFNE